MIHDICVEGTKGSRYEFTATIVGQGLDGERTQIFERKGTFDGFFSGDEEVRLFDERLSYGRAGGVICSSLVNTEGLTDYPTRSFVRNWVAPLSKKEFGDEFPSSQSYELIFREFHPFINFFIFFSGDANAVAPKVARRLAATFLHGCNLNRQEAARSLAYGLHAELEAPHWKILTIRLVDKAAQCYAESLTHHGEMHRAQLNALARELHLTPQRQSAIERFVTGDGGKLALDAESADESVEPKYVETMRRALRGLFIDGADALPDALLETLLNAKRQAIDMESPRFNEAVQELATEVESYWRREPGNESAVEAFYAVLHHFDAYEALSGIVFRIAMVDGYAPSPEHFQSLAKMWTWLECLRPGLFRRLYFDPIARDLALGMYGRRRLELLSIGIEEMNVGKADARAALHRIAALSRRPTPPRCSGVAGRVQVNDFECKRRAPPA